MSVTIRRLDALLAANAVTQLNKLRVDLLKVQAGLIFHADTSPADATPTAVDLPTSITMANNLKAAFNTHMASAVSATTGIGVHIVADVVNGPVATANATDLTSVEALLNALKTAFNAHLTQSGVHATNDGTNSVATANATDLPTSEALANALQTKMNAHWAASLNQQALNVVNP